MNPSYMPISHEQTGDLVSAELSSQTREQKLFKQRSLFLCEAVSAQTAKKFVSDLLILNQENQDPITLYVNSPGGEVTSGFAIYDTIKFIKAPVHIINTGLCASIATIINVAVPKKHRFSMPNTRFLIHQPLIHGWVQGPAADVEITANEIVKTRETLNRILSTECDQPFAKICEDTLRDYWMNAPEALDYGLIGSILTHQKELL
jgi:ATP-dependent Clp protease protease subunit